MYEQDSSDEDTSTPKNTPKRVRKTKRMACSDHPTDVALAIKHAKKFYVQLLLCSGAFAEEDARHALATEAFRMAFAKSGVKAFVPDVKTMTLVSFLLLLVRA